MAAPFDSTNGYTLVACQFVDLSLTCQSFEKNATRFQVGKPAHLSLALDVMTDNMAQ